MNLYAYAGNNPVVFSDPFGLKGCPKEAGGDGKTDRYDDCPQGTSGYYAYKASQRQGGLLNDIKGAFASCRENTACKWGGIGVVTYTGARLAYAGYTALSGTGAAAATATAGGLPLAASAGPKLAQLADRFGTTADELVMAAVNTGQKLIDVANRGNINALIPRLDGASGFIRVTLDPTMQRVVSAGMMRANQVANGVANGRFVPME